MDLFKHSSTTMRMSDSESSVKVRNVSMAIPRNFGKSATDLQQKKFNTCTLSHI